MQRLACYPGRVSTGINRAFHPNQPRRPTFIFIVSRNYGATSDSRAAQHTGTHSPTSEHGIPDTSPFCFLTGYATFAKRPSRPFPPPFLSLPSGSFSDPLSTHNRSVDRRQKFEGEVIRGITNGDDAVLASQRMVGVGDGVGAWAQKERGHAALWSRLILHFWALEAERARFATDTESDVPALQSYLHKAYEHTKAATAPPNEWFGTTTASAALVTSNDAKTKPLLQVTQLGDSKVMVIRQSSGDVIYRTEEQWHWFDCPRQLGTNSPDTPEVNAVTDLVECEEDDIVLAISDGVSDNLWEHEVVTNLCESIRNESDVLLGSTWLDQSEGRDTQALHAMRRVAGELVRASRVIAEDPFAESPFMERAVEEGLPTEGGKLDDISVVVALCKRRQPD